MPYTKRRNYKRRPRRNIHGTKPKFMPRSLAVKRYNQVSTKTFYFKGNGTVAAGTNGIGQALWSTRTRTLATPGQPSYLTPGVPGDFLRISRAYNEYKILCIKLTLYPANVGTEGELPGVSVNPFQRGNCVTYIEQKITVGQQIPNAISAVMCLGSAKMFTPRYRHSRVIYRPKGYPEWGQCDGDVVQSQWKLDPWWGGLLWLINGATQDSPPIAFYQVTYKVIFRGRNRVPGGTVTTASITDPDFITAP